MRETARGFITGAAIIAMLVGAPSGVLAAAAKVVVDAGHGGQDSGAVGVNGLYEKTVNLAVAQKLRDELTRRGYDVYMTRDTDTYLTLAERMEATNRAAPDLFVSIHANDFSSPAARGTLVLYYDKDYPQEDYPASDSMTVLTPQSKRLAQAVQSATVKEAGLPDRGIVPSAVYVVRMGTFPSALVETAFLSNWQDAALLADDGFRDKLARGIANGIAAYMPAVKPDPGPFSDVALDYWAAPQIALLKERRIVEGDVARFYPQRSLTRAEFVAMLTRQYPEAVKSKEAAPPASAKDLPQGHWAYDLLQQALQSGLLNGYEDGTVRPDGPITRGEAAVLLDRVLHPGASAAAASSVFKDVPVKLWSAAAINRLKAEAVIDGVTANTYVPERSITRAEMSALLGRLLSTSTPEATTEATTPAAK